MTEKSRKTLLLSSFVNELRKFFIRKGFFEYVIYSSIPYRIENTDQFKLKKNLFLRYGTEPEIWNIGEHFDRFFCITSLFRREKKLTKIHNYEFKILDFYVKDGSMKEIVGLFLKCLKNLEKILEVMSLSGLPVSYVAYENFHKKSFNSRRKEWLVVTNYPKEESFYDTPRGDGTNKFEIMFSDSKEIIEIASGGVVGKNINSEMYIKKDENFINRKIFRKRFIGLGVGIERLAYVYGNKLR